MSRIRFFWKTITIVLAVFVSSFSFAQSSQPLAVEIMVAPPYPNYVSEVIGMSDQTIITIHNTNLTSGYSFRLQAQVDGNNGIIIRSKENSMPSQPLEIGPGETLVLSGEEVSTFYNNFTESDFDFIGINRQSIINNQQLPDGMYTLCLRAFDYYSAAPLSSSSPSGCSSPFVVIAADPPIITYPQNNTTLTPVDPQLISINWIPVNISLSDLRYKIEMIDLTDLPVNPYDAFNTSAFLFFNEDDIAVNTFLYGMESPMLTLGHRYAIRIKAYREDGPLNVLNNGYSEVVTFTYGEIPQDEGDAVTDSQLIPDQGLDCGQECIFAVSNQTASSTPPKVGDMLDIGNFKMKVTSIQGSGSYKGSGVIQPTSFFPVGIKVNFEDVKINAQKRVFAGKAKSVIREDSWIDHTWSDIQTAVNNVNVGANTMSKAVSTLTSPDFYVENLQNIYSETGTSLPFTIGSGTDRMQVVGINFFPDRASYNLSSIIELFDDAKGDTEYLNFLAKDLCFTPGGPALSANEARLELVKPVGYNFDNNTRLEFLPAGTGEGEGTYLTFDCDGFNAVFAEGKAVFSTEVFKPANADGTIIQNDSVTAHFKTQFTSWSNWIATLKFTQGENQIGTDKFFVYSELDEYLISIDEAFIDHDMELNPDGMVFPEDYQMDQSNEWQGVYIKSLQVILPEWMKAHDQANGRIHLSAKDLLIDSDGISGKIEAHNVLSQDEGALGKWPVTVNEVKINIFQNSLQQAYFTGELKIPIIDEPFAYKADLQFLNGKTKHTFTFESLDDYTIPMWFANTTIEENSYLTVSVTNKKAYVEAMLNGKMSFAPVIGGIDKMGLTDITFQNLIVRSEKAPDYIEVGHIGTGLSNQSFSVAGFGVMLDYMEWKEKLADLSSLDLGLVMNLSGDMFGISGGTGLQIKNSINEFVDSLSFNFEGVDISNIDLAAQTGIVDIEGEIAFFKDDPKFGEGFEGSLMVRFLKDIELSGQVLFGNVEEEGSDKFNYWYAHATAYMPNVPVPMATPVDIYGFGGGVYNNLSLDKEFPNPGDVNTGTNPRDFFNVQRGIIGLQASVILGLTPSSQTFNADVGLTAEINMNTGGLNLVAFTGSGYVMQDIEEEDKEHAMVQANVYIMYDFPHKTLAANFGVVGRVPYSNPLLKLNGNIDIYRSPTLWYLKAGVPDNPMSASINLGISGITAKGYFMTGQQLPAPVLPAKARSFFNFDSNLANNVANNMGIGFLAGVHLGIRSDMTLAGTGVQLEGLAGVDLALMNYFASMCNGSENFGVNKWYAQGQAYLYGSAVLKFFTAEVATVSVGIIVEAAFPNPTGVSGRIMAKAGAFGLSTDFNEKFTFGSFCNIQPMANADELIYRQESELDHLPLLGFVTPENGKTNASTAIKPQIQWFQKHGTKKRFVYGDGQGGIIDLKYQIQNKVEWEQQEYENGPWTKVYHDRSMEDEIMTLKAANPVNGIPSLLHGSRTYRIKAQSWIEVQEGYQWVQAKYTEGDKKGQPIIEAKTNVFNTGSNLTEIEEMYVDYTLPYPRQRYYPYEYLSMGKIKFNIDHEPKFQDFETCGFDIYAEFTPINGSGSPSRQKVVRPQTLEAKFDMSVLNPETIYKLQIVAERTVGVTENMITNNPACKIPSSGSTAILMDNINTIAGNYNLNVNLINFGGMTSSGSSGGSADTPTNTAVLNTSGLNTISKFPAATNPGLTTMLSNNKVTHRKVLYTIHFRTSKYGTPEEKMNSMTVRKFKVKPTVLNLQYLPDLIVKDIDIELDCGEGFDKYDLFGHDYQTPETKEYFRISGASCAGISWGTLTDEQQEWLDYICPTYAPTLGIDHWDHAAENRNQFINEMWSVIPGLDMEYKNDPSNYTGKKHIKPLLSDSEIQPQDGMSMTNFVYQSPIIQGALPTGGAVYLNPVWSTGSTGGSLTPTTVMVSGEDGPAELEVIYELDRRAAQVHNYKLKGDIETMGESYSNMLINDFPYDSPPSGTYPFRIKLMNYTTDAKPDDEPIKSRTIQLTIPY